MRGSCLKDTRHPQPPASKQDSLCMKQIPGGRCSHRARPAGIEIVSSIAGEITRNEPCAGRRGRRPLRCTGCGRMLLLDIRSTANPYIARPRHCEPARTLVWQSVERLAALPFPGLLCDGPPMARLRRFRAAFLCYRQRRPAILPAANLRPAAGSGLRRADCHTYKAYTSSKAPLSPRTCSK